MDSLPSVIGTLLGSYWELWLSLAAALSGLVMWIQKGAINEPGRDQEKLLQALSVGGDLRRIYVARLSRALDRADSFLKDAGKAEFSLPSPFGNTRPAPYWTGRSFDTCAQVAIIYPLLSVFATWSWNGDAGALGRGLGLEAGAPPLMRLAATFILVCAWSLYWGAMYPANQRQRFWRTLGVLVIGMGVVVVRGVDPFAYALGGVGAFTFGYSDVAAGAVAFPVALAFAFGLADPGDLGNLVAAIVSFALAFAVAFVYLNGRFSARNRVGRFWLAYWPVATGACFLGLHEAAVAGLPRQGLLLLVMIGLVPMVNIPFDWASVGVTRALLRRGCEPGAPSPFWLGLGDLLLGLALLIMLALALAATLVLANYLAAHPHAPVLINLPQLLHQLATTPGNPDIWWVYLTLFSTMVPSALNCVIGAASLITWSLPPLRTWMLETIPTLQPTGFGTTRAKLLLAMGFEVFVGTLLTGAAFRGLYWVGNAAAPSALHDVLGLAKAWLRLLTGTG